MNKMVLKSVSALLVVLVLCLIGMMVYASYQARSDPSRIPSIFGFKPLTVLTNSMEPSINAGDMVFVKEKKAEEIKKGDVITFWREDGKLITHRVFKITDEGFETKGDNNNVKDNGKVLLKDVVGQVRFTFPKAGYIAEFVTGKIGFSLFIILPLLFYVLIEVYQRVIRYLEKKEEAI